MCSNTCVHLCLFPGRCMAPNSLSQVYEHFQKRAVFLIIVIGTKSLLGTDDWSVTCFFSEGPVLGGCSHTLGCNQCSVFPVVWEVRCSVLLHPHHSSGHRCESCGKPVSLGVLESLRFTVSLCVIYVCVGREMWRPEVGIRSIFYLQCLDRVS